MLPCSTFVNPTIVLDCFAGSATPRRLTLVPKGMAIATYLTVQAGS